VALKIDDVGELNQILARVYWVESQLELTLEWEAYIVVKDKYRDILFTISHDSAAHKTLVIKMGETLEGIDIEDAAKTLDEKKFDLRGRQDEEILTQILKYEKLALDLYTRLHSYSDGEFIKKLWKGENSDEYFKNLQWLMGQEQKHVALVKPYVGLIERIL
jgi:hypothetical protein